MTRPRALFWSAALTAFVLVTVAAAVGRWTAGGAASASLDQRGAPVQADSRTPPEPTRPAAAATVGVGPARAVELAVDASPGSRVLQVPELVVYEGRDAYEVLLDHGPVYVDAHSGALLSSWLPVAVQPEQARRSGERHREHDEDEHHRERHDEDDDD